MRHYQACQFAKPKNTNCERRFLKTAKRSTQLISIVPYSRRPCAYRALFRSLIRRARKEGPQKGRKRASPVPLVRSEHDDIRTGARENESEYMEACTNERGREGASERTIRNQILSLTRPTTRRWWRRAGEGALSRGLAPDTDLLGATVSGPFESRPSRKSSSPSERGPLLPARTKSRASRAL